MKITKIKIENYKSFRESTSINFSPGFNVIVGKNNCGKTALVEILSLKYENIPHDSKANSPEIGIGNLNRNSTGIYSFEISGEELRRILSNRTDKFLFPHNSDKNQDNQLKSIIGVLESENTSIETRIQNEDIDLSFFPVTGKVETGTAFRFNPTNLEFDQLTGGYSKAQDAAYILARQFKGSVYHFRAERFHVGQQDNKTYGAILKPDASNLPSVLDTLLSEKKQIFKDFMQEVHIVFPKIHDVSVRLEENNSTIKIYLSMIDPQERRYDLDIPLQDSGTGIGQILAILYVVVTSQAPQILVIDEPQSFLHPGAVRRLFNVLQEKYSHHQYILTTHSPTVISSANPQNIIQLYKENEVTKVKNIDIQQANEMRLVLADVGARLSDVFGADNILWVEGKTEEECFPKIILAMCKANLLGTAIIGVLQTGDFEAKNKKDVRKTIRIYNQLSKSSALIPPAIGFIFDREGRSEDDINELSKEGKGAIHFLPRKMFENYLLIPEVLTKYISSQQPDFSEKEITLEAIENWIEKNKWNDDFFFSSIPDGERNDATWRKQVRGDKFLDDMFKTLSDHRYSYCDSKVEFGIELTQIILDIAREEFDEIANLIDEILGYQ